MANNTRIRGITIEINGDASGFNKALKSVNGDLRSTQSQLKDVNKLLKLDPGNADLLQQKQRMLNQALAETRQKLELEKQALRDIAAQNTTGEQQAQQDALQREVIETEAKVKSLEKEVKNFGSVGAQQVAALGDKFKEIGSKISDVGRSMTTHLTVPIMAAFGAATAAATEYEENVNKIETAFGDSAQSVRAWADNAIEQFGLSKLAATNATSAFGALAKGIGITESTAAGMSTTLAGLSADLASYFNTGTDESAKALEAIFTGEAEALKKYGVVMTETNVKDFAAQHGQLYDQLSNVQKVMVRYQYVLEHTSDAQGDYARTADGTANSMKTFKAAVEDLGVAFGEEILPVITPIVKALTDLIRSIGELPEPVRKGIVVIGLVVAAIGPLLTVIGGLISGIGSIMSIVPGLVGALGAGGVATAGTAAAGGIGAAGAAIAGLAGPIAIAGAAALALGFSIGALADHWPEITAAAKRAVDSVKSKLSEMATSVKNSKVGQEAQKVANTMRKSFADAGGGIKGVMAAAFNGIKTVATDTGMAIQRRYGDDFQRIAQTVNNHMNNVRNYINNGINSAKTTVASAATSMRSAISTEFTSASTTVTKQFNEIKSSASKTKESIESGWNSLKSSASSIFSNGYDSIKSKIQSVFETITNNATSSKTSFSDMMTSMKSSASTNLDSITTSVKNAYDKAKTTLATALKMSFTSDFKTPSIMVEGSFDVDRYGSITKKPKLSLKWNKSAMQFGAILDGATIFGMMGNTMLGGGEAGKEAIIGVHSLYDLVHRASSNGNGLVAQRVDALTNLLMQYLPDIAADKGVYLNDGALVGQLMPSINRSLGLLMT